MKFAHSLPVLVVLAVFVSLPAMSYAQAPASAPAPAFYAQLGLPATSSSSSNAFLYDARAQATTPAKVDTGSGKPFSGLGVGFKLGLAGIGFDVATPLVPQRLNLRGGATFFSYNLSETTSDNLVVNGTLKLQNSGVMVDWFPFHGSFRLSGGATVYNNKGVTASINEPNGSSFTLGGTTYYASGPIVGTGTFKLGGNAGGRVSFGWGNLVPKPGHRFSFDTELGIEFVSKPTVALGFTGNYCTGTANCESPTPIAGNAAFANSVTSEQNKLQSDVNFLSFYPIVSVGIGYKLF
ncbi:MAG: hypothetical protein ABSG84_08800 [Acidobacteriaceae bacterium]|jgi:hypothetical protein